MDTIAQTVEQVLARVPAEIRQEAALASSTMSMEARWMEHQRLKVRWINESIPENPLTDCAKCGGRGYFACVDDEGRLTASYCTCMGGRVEAERMRRSGLSSVYRRFTLGNYKTDRPWQRDAKIKAEAFVKDPRGWLFIGGRSGSGKTHLCTGICGALIERGRDVRYMTWRSEAPRLKSCVNDYSQYDKQINIWKNAPILYIDDFWKGKITDGDINLGFEILNHRDMSNRPTILSTEMTIEAICEVDEAIGSRIAARSRGMCIKTPDENYRLRA